MRERERPQCHGVDNAEYGGRRADGDAHDSIATVANPRLRPRVRAATRKSLRSACIRRPLSYRDYGLNVNQFYQAIVAAASALVGYAQTALTMLASIGSDWAQIAS